MPQTIRRTRISKETACQFLVRYQHLDDSQPLWGTDGILEYIRKVGCIQYDPLNMVSRNADLVLQARIKDYRPPMLENLLYKERSLIDGWDKMMSIYSRDDWPYFQWMREEKGRETIAILQHRNSSGALLCTDAVIESLAQNGPMLPKQLAFGSAGVGRWGHRNLSSAAMDYLFHIGRIGVAQKANVNKVYDLMENLLPASLLAQPNPFETEYDFCKWYVYRRIGSVGMLWNRNGGGWLNRFLQDKKLRQRILDEHVENGLVQCVEVEGIPDTFYVRSKDLPFETGKPIAPEHMRFIAPLDNLLWDREILSQLFGFAYTWEVYLPAEKRKYGYYVIPVLWGNRFVARFEPEKSASHLCIKNWWWEAGITASSELTDCAMRTMAHFATYLGKSEGVHESVQNIIQNG